MKQKTKPKGNAKIIRLPQSRKVSGIGRVREAECELASCLKSKAKDLMPLPGLGINPHNRKQHNPKQTVGRAVRNEQAQCTTHYPGLY